MSRLKIFTASEIKAFDKPPKLSAKQKQQAFALTESVISTISRLRSPDNKVALLLGLGYFRVSGRFFSPSDFHRSDIVAASKILNLNPVNIDLSDYQSNHRRHLEHKKLVLNLLGFSAFNRDAKKILQEIISKLAEHDGDPREMIYHACAQLHQQNIEIPAYDTFLRLITDALNQVEHQYEDTIAKHINQEQEALLGDLIYTDEDTHFARLNQWKVISQSERPAKIQASVSVYNDIKRLFLQLLPLMDKLSLSDNAIRYYSGWVERSKLSQLKQLKPTERYLRLIAFIQSQMYLRQDYLVDTLIKSAKACRNNAMGKNQKNSQGQQNKRNTAINKLISGHTNLKEFYDKIKEIIFNHAILEKEKLSLIQKLVESSENKETIDPEDAKKILKGLVNNTHYYDALELGFTKLKNRVEAIILSMSFDEPSSCKKLLLAIEHYREFKLGSKKIDANSPTQFLETDHVKQLTDSEGKYRSQLYKTLLFLYVADGMKHGKLNLSHSYRFRALGEYLIDSKSWEENKEALIKAAGIDHLKDIRQLISELKKILDEKYCDVNERINSGNNKYISFKGTGQFKLRTPNLYDKSQHTSMRELFADLPFIPIVQVLMETNQKCQFLDAFKHYNRKHHKMKPNPITLIAGIISLGCNIGAQKTAGISIGINENNLKNTLKWFFSTKNIRAANDKVLSMIKRLALPKLFQYDEQIVHTSSDGKKKTVMVDSLLATRSFKYLGKDKGVSAYSFIDITGGLFYSTVISPAEREATYLLDGLLHNEVIKSDLHSTDTHGYTELIFGVTHLIGASFAPRIKKAGHQTLYSFKTKGHYSNKGYQVLPSRPIDTKIIEEHWDDILKLIVSLKLKYTTASQVIKRINAYSDRHPLYKTLKEFGRIIKSSYILTYADDVKLRQCITKVLNTVELSNKFSDAVFHEQNGEFHVGAVKDQIKATECKALIQNCIVLWNYLYLTEKLASLDKQERKQLLQMIEAGSIQSWGHINMKGEFDFTRESMNDSMFDLKKILEFKLE